MIIIMSFLGKKNRGTTVLLDLSHHTRSTRFNANAWSMCYCFLLQAKGGQEEGRKKKNNRKNSTLLFSCLETCRNDTSELIRQVKMRWK